MKLNTKSKKLIFFLFILFLLLAFFFVVKIFVFSKAEYIEYNKYDCITKIILDDCKNSSVLFSLGHKNEVDEDGKWRGVVYPIWQHNKEKEKDFVYIKDFILKKEENLLSTGSSILYGDFVVGCDTDEKDMNKARILTFRDGIFRWKNRTLDCAWVRNEEKNFIKEFNIVSFSVISILGITIPIILLIFFKKNKN